MKRSNLMWAFVGCMMAGACTMQKHGPSSGADLMKGYTRWNLPVFLQLGDQKYVDSLGRALGDAIGVSGVMVAEENPICCFWVDVHDWTPRPSMPGYVMLIMQEGAVLQASDAEQAEIAIERLRADRRIINGQIWLPVGVLTNYPVRANSAPRE